MLEGIAWVVVGAFYLLTVLWIVYLWLLFRDRMTKASAFARWMARLAALEGAASLNAAAGALMALVGGAFTLSLYRPVLALAFSVAQVVYLHNDAKANA